MNAISCAAPARAVGVVESTPVLFVVNDRRGSGCCGRAYNEACIAKVAAIIDQAGKARVLVQKDLVVRVEVPDAVLVGRPEFVECERVRTTLAVKAVVAAEAGNNVCCLRYP